MSKLIDRLAQAAEAVPSPMGFGAARATPTKPKIALIARIESSVNAVQLANYLSSADAIIMDQTGAGEEVAQSLMGVAWGLWSEDLSRQQIKSLAENGADFIILSLNLEFGLTGTEKVGKILLVESSLSDGLIRTINEMPAEAVLLTIEEEPLTWYHLMLCQRFSDLLFKPMLLMVPISVDADGLKALWKAGADGVVVPVKTPKEAERLKKLRQLIDKSDFAARPRKKVAALLPPVYEEKSAVAGEVEEEEE